VVGVGRFHLKKRQISQKKRRGEKTDFENNSKIAFVFENVAAHAAGGWNNGHRRVDAERHSCGEE